MHNSIKWWREASRIFHWLSGSWNYMFWVWGRGQKKCDTHGFCYSLVYVTEFIGKVCLPLKTLCRLEDVWSCSIHWVQPMVSSVPRWKPWGPCRREGSEKTLPPCCLLVIESRTSPAGQKTLHFCLKSWKDSWLPYARGCWETGIPEVPWQPGSCSQPISVERLPKLLLRGSTIESSKWISGQIPKLGAVWPALRFLNWILSLEQSSVLKPLSRHLNSHCCLPWNVSITVLLFIEQH